MSKVTFEIVQAIADKWELARDKHIDISFPKSAHPAVMKCLVDAARGDVYDLLAYIGWQTAQIASSPGIVEEAGAPNAAEKLRRFYAMEREGITEQEIAETMPPRQGEEGR